MFVLGLAIGTALGAILVIGLAALCMDHGGPRG